MKHKQNGSVTLILISISVVLLTGALTYVFLKNINRGVNTISDKSAISQAGVVDDDVSAQAYVEFKDWGVRFSAEKAYSLKLNSVGNTYFISDQVLAGMCATPDTPWLGTIQRFENPEEKQTTGPDAGKTMSQIFGSKGKIIEGKLYYFDTATQFCTRGTSNPEVEQAAKKLESEISSLEAY